LALAVLAVVGLAGAMGVGRAAAQVPNGSISGTVYLDANQDGTCAATGEPGPAGIAIEFLAGDNFTRVYRETDGAGNFVLLAAGFGTWNVTVMPGGAYDVTGEATRQVVVTQEVPHVAGIVFCIVASADGGSGEDGGTVLPGTGAALGPGIMAAGIAGVALIAIGLGLIGLSRRRT
jgi:hypothetical protein